MNVLEIARRALAKRQASNELNERNEQSPTTAPTDLISSNSFISSPPDCISDEAIRSGEKNRQFVEFVERWNSEVFARAVK